jgi:hypothetical protein
MIKKILIITLAIATIIAGWSKWVWVTCGYDCGVFGVTQGPASVVGWYLGLFFIFVSGVGLVINYFVKKRT